MNRLSLNTYSIDELIRVERRASFSSRDSKIVDTVTETSGELDLLDVPHALSQRGIGAVDFCYYHFSSTEDSYLERLRTALQEAGVELFCLLVDFGNLTQPDSQQRQAELEWTAEWIRRASILGAHCVRPRAGDADPDDPAALRRAVDGYMHLADIADQLGVRLLTENLGSFVQGADTLLKLLDRLDGRVGLVADFGNGRHPGEYESLRRLLPRAESVHAKPEIDENEGLLEEDFITAVRLAEESGFTGPYTLVYRGPQAPWQGIERTRDLVLGAIAPE